MICDKGGGGIIKFILIFFLTFQQQIVIGGGSSFCDVIFVRGVPENVTQRDEE